MNALNNFDKNVKKYSTAPSHDLIRLRGSKVKVTAGCQGGEGIDVETGTLKSSF